VYTTEFMAQRSDSKSLDDEMVDRRQELNDKKQERREKGEREAAIGYEPRFARGINYPEPAQV
jgi:hypothetical protein